MNDVADYLFERTRRRHLRSFRCPFCDEWITDIDGERLVFCACERVEEKEAKCAENKEKIAK